MPPNHVLYGVPGVGKSTIAASLAARDGRRHVELDALRPTAPARGGERPRFTSEYTTNAWRRFGALNAATATAGYLGVRAANAPAVALALAEEPSGYVAESAFIDPRIAQSAGAGTVLIVTHDELLHYHRFFAHRSRSEAGEREFEAARLIQEYLISEAASLGIELIDNGLPAVDEIDLQS